MENDVARLVAGQLRTGMKDRALSGVQLADEIERLTGARPSKMQVSRWLNAVKQLARVDPDLYPLCRALGLDPAVVVADAIRRDVGARAAPGPKSVGAGAVETP